MAQCTAELPMPGSDCDTLQCEMPAGHTETAIEYADTLHNAEWNDRMIFWESVK